MFKPRKTFLAAAVVGTFALGAAGLAQAVPVASAVSVVSFENFVINWESDGRQVDADTDFVTGFPSVTSTMQTSAGIPGTPGISDLQSSSTGADLTSVSSLGTVDPVIDSAGSFLASDAFNVPALPLIGNFAHSVSNETGSPIENFFASANSADLHNASYASLDSLVGTAGASTSSQLASTQEFISTVDGDELVFSFNLGAYIGAFLDADAAQSASASWNVTFSLVNQSLAFGDPARTAASFTAGDAISNNAPGTGDTVPGGSNTGLTGDFLNLVGPISFTSDAIVAGDRYLLTANISTTTRVERVQQVPEPATIALLGLGLAGLGMVGIRRKRSM